MEFALLAEHDRFTAAHEADGRYHLAKLVARILDDPEAIWREHEEYRAGFQPTTVVTPDLIAQGTALWQRALAKGIIPPRSAN